MKSKLVLLLSIPLLAISAEAKPKTHAPVHRAKAPAAAIACPIDENTTRQICELRKADDYTGLFGDAQVHQNIVDECVEDCAVNDDVISLCSPEYAAFFQQATGSSVEIVYPAATLKAYCDQEFNNLRSEFKASDDYCASQTGIKGSYWMGDHCKYQPYQCSTGVTVDNSDPSNPVYGSTWCYQEQPPRRNGSDHAVHKKK